MTTPDGDDKLQNSTKFSTDMYFITNTVHMAKKTIYFHLFLQHQGLNPGLLTLYQ